MSWSIEPLGEQHNRAAFSCEHESLTQYLVRQTFDEPQRYLAANFVACEHGSERVLGYYALTASVIERTVLPKATRRLLQQYVAYPAILLGRLARDITQRGTGMGEFLLVNAIRRAVEIAEEFSGVAVVVDAIDAKAYAWYEKYGFEPAGDGSRLLMPMHDVRETFRQF